MRIGIKLHMGFEQREDYRRLYDGRDIGDWLRAAGVSATEVPVKPDTDETDLLRHVERCHEIGLHVSLHPYTERDRNNLAHFEEDRNNPCRQLYERFFHFAARTAEIQGEHTIINVHPASGFKADDRRELIERSVRFFQWARPWCGQLDAPVEPTAELLIRENPGEDIARCGDRWDELMEIVQRSEVRACWDFGHSGMNHLRYGDPQNPPADLLPRVCHVHCHDINDEDHRPLIYGRVPWQRHLCDLTAAGFDGTVILEIVPEHLFISGGLESLEQSLTALRNLKQPQSR